MSTIALDRFPPRTHSASVAVRVTAWIRHRWTDAWWIALLALALSIGFFAWYHAHGLTLEFNDARIRELIARRVLFGRTPGLGQLGTTWLPLPSLLMLPLIWNNALFRDGLAGSLPSMLAYVVAAVYMYRIGRLVTGSRVAGWVAALILMLNPSLLYMQTTAMSEVLSLSAFVVAIYYAIRAAQTHGAPDLVKCAAAVAAGTLVRYDDWALGFALLPILALIAWRALPAHRSSEPPAASALAPPLPAPLEQRKRERRSRYAMAESWTILFALLAFAGCAGWVIYNWVIFGDPLLSFFYGQSSHTYYSGASTAEVPARHHPVLALQMYGLTVAKTVGWLMIPVAVLGLVAFVRRHRRRDSMLPVYLVLLPFAFYWLVLVVGINTELLPQLGQGSYYNVRFGLAMIPAVALFSACIAVTRKRLLNLVLAGGVLTVTLAASVVGWIQTPLVEREALYGQAGADTRPAGEHDAQWFAAHYHGGNVLITYVNSQTMIFYLLTSYHFPDHVFITDTNGAEFHRALARPWESVRWIVMDSYAHNGASPIWTALSRQTDWRSHFILRAQFGTRQIYERGVSPSAAAVVPAAAGVAAPLAAHSSLALPKASPCRGRCG